MALDPQPKYNPYRREIIHNQHRRAFYHNYDAPGTYLITIVINGRRPLFGQLVASDVPYIALSELGKQISSIEVPKISTIYPMVSVWRTCIMPDHIHLIVNISDYLPLKKHLGHVIGGFKGACSRAWWRLCVDSSHDPIFEEGYNDGILFDDGQLDSWKKYITDNPRRLAIKRANPDLFKVWHNKKIGDWSCQMIGNIFLLDIPDIMAVIVHRADSDDAYAEKFKSWMACGERGGVLVSAAIAKREKLVMREAMDRGYRLIVLRENGFHRYYKPSGSSFEACARGSMLQICPWDYHHEKLTIKRSQCLELNNIALCISGGR